VMERTRTRSGYESALSRRPAHVVHDSPKPSGMSFYPTLRKTNGGVDDLTSIVGQKFDIVKGG
jgi:hypothetical protein